MAMKKKLRAFMRRHQWYFHVPIFLLLSALCVLVITGEICLSDEMRTLFSEFLGTFMAIYFSFLVFLLSKGHSEKSVTDSKTHHETQIMKSIHAQMAVSERIVIAQHDAKKELIQASMLASENIIKAINDQQPHILQDDLRLDLFEFEIDQAICNLNIRLYSAIVKYQELEVFKWFRASSIKRVQLKYQHKEIDYIKEELNRLEKARKKLVN
jgi:hypothetical protein